MEAHNWYKNGYMHCYTFGEWEKKVIAQALKPEIKKLHKQIEKIKNDPKNEGQVDFIEQISEIRGEIKTLENTINEFSQ